MALTVDVVVERPDFRFAIATSFAPGITCVLGPSGAGKSTLLGAISGLLRPTIRPRPRRPPPPQRPPPIQRAPRNRTPPPAPGHAGSPPSRQRRADLSPVVVLTATWATGKSPTYPT